MSTWDSPARTSFSSTPSFSSRTTPSALKKAIQRGFKSEASTRSANASPKLAEMFQLSSTQTKAWRS